MTIKQILQYPNARLSTVAQPIETIDETILALAVDLQETAKVYRAEGLAANQVGELVRMFVIKDAITEEYITCINPEILAAKTDLLDSMEGCLSFPGVNQKVKRSEAVHARYQDEGGQVVEVWFTGVNAVAYQHELDHLNGILFTEHMGKLQKRMALKKLTKVQRHGKRQFKHMQKILAEAERRATV